MGGNPARKRRRRRAGVEGRTEYDGVPDRDIYARDGWQCQMPDCTCPAGRAIDPAVPAQHRWGPSIDHIIPLGEGGPDTADNKRAAHTRCNNVANRRRHPRRLAAGPYAETVTAGQVR
jgi:hypothetical protein